MKKNVFKKKLLCLFLCSVMLVSLALAGCNGNEEQQAEPENKVDVPRLASDITAGTRITEDMLQTAAVATADLPEGTMLNKSDIVGKFAKTDMYKGEYFFESKLLKQRPNVTDDEEEQEALINFETAGYVLVTDYLQPDTGKDVSDAIQKLVDENPNRTLYFPDGVYLISKSIQTSADPAKSVSFKFSNYAQLKAMDSWSAGQKKVQGPEDFAVPNLKAEDIKSEGTPLLHFGAKDKDAADASSPACYSVEGGILHGSSKADAIWVEGASKVDIRYTAIKFAVVGLYVKGGESGNEPIVDVYNVNVIGTGVEDSVGVILETDSNTLTNMRLVSNHISIMVSGSNNFLRNLHPLYSGHMKTGWEKYYNSSVAFYDTGARNFYDMCYNDQYSTGFYMGSDTASVYESCFNFWFRGSKTEDYVFNQIAFRAEGQFNSFIRFTTRDFSLGVPTENYPVASYCNFLVVGDDNGSGQIEGVYFLSANIQNKDREKYLDYLINDSHIEK